MSRLAWLAVLALVGCGAPGGAGNGDDDPGVDGGNTGDGGDPNDPDGGTPDGNNVTCSASESCDGVIDDDCDGTVDEDCGRCPLMTLACPTGCCPVDRWEVSMNRSRGVDLAVAADGTIYLVYSVPSGGPWQATLAIYDPVPGTWRSVPLGLGTYRNRVRLDNLGRVHVATGGSSGPLSYRRSDDRGVSFTTPIVLGTLDIGGTFDMELDALGQPHIVFDQYQQSSSQKSFVYKHLAGASWVTESPDIVTDDIRYADLALGFADRPHVVYDGHDGSPNKSYVFYNGNRWVLETVDVATGTVYTPDGYFASHSLRIAQGDARELMFTRRNGGVDTMFLARRGPGDLDTWQVTALTGPTGFQTPVMFTDVAGKLAAIGDGLTIYREQSGTMWSTTAVGVPGENAAIVRRGKYFYVAYTADNEHPTLAVIELQ